MDSITGMIEGAALPREWLLFSLFALVTLIHLWWHWYYFRRIAFSDPESHHESGALTPVSVVLTARNEYDHLSRHLPLLLGQDHPEYEVVVVNDASNDGTDQLLREMQRSNTHLKVVNLNSSVSFMQGKKLPLSVGIRSAKHELLLLTEAASYPADKAWVSRMAAQLEQDKEIVLGYGAFEKKPGLLNKLIRLDNLTTALNYMGMAAAGRPFMGSGRNLAYTRSLFYRLKGFTSHYKIAAGDDDLFINYAARKDNTVVEPAPAAHTVSVPDTTFAGRLRTKKQWLSSRRYYKKRDRRMLRLYKWAQLLFYPLFAVSMIVSGFSTAGLLVLGVFLLRTTSYLMIIRMGAKTLREGKICLFSLPGELILMGCSLLLSLSPVWMKKNKWK